MLTRFAESVFRAYTWLMLAFGVLVWLGTFGPHTGTVVLASLVGLVLVIAAGWVLTLLDRH